MNSKKWTVAREQIKEMGDISEKEFEEAIMPIYNAFDTIKLEEVVKMYKGHGDHRICYGRLKNIVKEAEASRKAEYKTARIFDDLNRSFPNEIRDAFQNHRASLWERGEKDIAAWRKREPLPGYESANYKD